MPLNSTIANAINPYIHPIQPVANSRPVGKRITYPVYRKVQMNIDTAYELLEDIDAMICDYERGISKLRDMQRKVKSLVGAR